MMVVGEAQEGNPTVIMLMWAKSSAELRGEILAGQLQLHQNPNLKSLFSSKLGKHPWLQSIMTTGFMGKEWTTRNRNLGMEF